MKLSILDQVPVSAGVTPKQAIEETIKLAKAADELGYTRYWVAEHHDLDGLASPAPDILLGIIGSVTKRIRVGSGAVLLPNYKPFNIAERYNVLATLFPGRVDIGIGRAPGGSAEVSIALADNFLDKVRSFPELIDELLHFLHQDFPEGHLYAKIAPSPVPEKTPTPWLLGTSGKSAILAAEKGLPYVFGHFMSGEDGPAIVKTYREQCKKTEPIAFVAVSVICAETTEEAEELALSNYVWKLQQDKGIAKNGVPSVEEAKRYPFTKEELETVQNMKEKLIVGNPKKVKQKLEQLQKEYEVDELMIVTITHSYEARKKSYELLAAEFGLLD
mgnify:FL=1